MDKDSGAMQMLEWARDRVWVVVVVAWALMVVDALPWWPDFQSGVQGLVRVTAIVGAAWLLVERARNAPAEEIYAAGYEAGRRAAADQLRDRMAVSGEVSKGLRVASARR